MTVEQFQKQYFMEFQGFLNSEMGKALQVVLMSERDRSHLIPTNGLEYSLTELSSAQFNREKGWDACFLTIRACAIPPRTPPDQIKQDYGIPDKPEKVRKNG